jgi:CRISPR-associated endonuclease Csn1
LCIYEALIEGKVIRELETYSILDIAKNKETRDINDAVPINLEKIIKKVKHLIPLLCALKVGQKVFFYQNEIDELKNLSNQEIGKRLYLITIFEDRNIRFKHHVNSMKEDDITKEMKRLKLPATGASFVNFNNPIPRLRLSQGALNMAIEGKHFEIKHDGEINWKF